MQIYVDLNFALPRDIDVNIEKLIIDGSNTYLRSSSTFLHKMHSSAFSLTRILGCGRMDRRTRVGGGAATADELMI